MMYEKQVRLKKVYIKIILIVFVMSIIIPQLININQVQAKITSNLPKSYMNDTFPDSYMPYINALKSAHPNWNFKAVYTGLDWNQAITHESYEVNEGISLVPDSYEAAWKKDGQNYYKDGNFVIASKEAVKYMLDPRGHLNEKEIFQFQTLSYSQSMDTIDSIEKVLYGTSMYNRSEYQKQGSMVNIGKRYSDIILESAKQYNVSAIHIASRIKQETGGEITSNRSINGSTVINGKIPYNYFNIGATPPDAITNGLAYAADKGWTDPDSAIKGGTEKLREGYIKWGQDTTYFQKFDVNNPYGNAKYLYGSQYMANILAPTNESYSTYNAYEKMVLNSAFEFHIPVFNNMPSSPSPYPGESGEENSYIADNTRIAAYDITPPNKLYIRSGPGTTYSIVAKLDDGNQMTRIAKSVNTQWDKVRLDSGIEGYVFRDYTIEVPTDVKVTGISLNTTNLELKLGDTYNLSCNITPSNATNQNVEWSSSNSDIVSVENGKLKANNVGSTTITVKAQDTGISVACNVNVVIKVSSIKLDENNITMNVNDEKTLNYTILPDNSTNKEVEWITSNLDIASVEDGKITAKKGGNVTITVKSKDTGLTDKCDITVISKVENISLEKEEYSVIKDRYITINPIITPDDATNKEYSITIEDENIAKVVDGRIKGEKTGETNVTFKTKDGEKSVTAKIKVIDISKSDFLKFDDTVKVDEKNNQISDIESGTKVSDLLTKTDYNKEKFDVVIKNTNGKIILDDNLIGTGTTVNLVTKDSKEVIQTYTVIIYGDVNGDGIIDSMDMYNVIQHILENKKLNDEFFKAGDTNSDLKIDSMDMYNIIQMILKR